MKTMIRKTPVTRDEYFTHHINRIQVEYPKLRNMSKGNTFALQYAGTPVTLSRNGGFSAEEATQIYENYHKAYSASKEFADSKKEAATTLGYVTCAFGLRVRTPLLFQSLQGHRLPYEAEAEKRTAGNALSQSYGLLNNRACNAFMRRVWASEYKYDVLPVALIHDAIYLMMRDDPKVVKFVNDTLIEEMEWQELPEIAHDKVKLGAALDLFYPSWANALTLPNRASQEEIERLVDEYIKEKEIE